MKSASKKPVTVWILLAVVTVDRFVSIFFGFEPDTTDRIVDFVWMAMCLLLVLTASRVVWSIMAILSLGMMGGTSKMIFAGALPLHQFSTVSIVHLVLGYTVFALLVLNPQILKWVWIPKAHRDEFA